MARINEALAIFSFTHNVFKEENKKYTIEILAKFFYLIKDIGAPNSFLIIWPTKEETTCWNKRYYIYKNKIKNNTVLKLHYLATTL